MVGGAAALGVIAKLADIAPAGMTTVGGTDATVESLLNSNAVVGAGSGKASNTVPTEGAPSRTVSGETDSAEMLPSACEAWGRRSANAVAEIATSQEVRRMTAPWDRIWVTTHHGTTGDTAAKPLQRRPQIQSAHVTTTIVGRACLCRGKPKALKARAKVVVPAGQTLDVDLT